MSLSLKNRQVDVMLALLKKQLKIIGWTIISLAGLTVILVTIILAFFGTLYFLFNKVLYKPIITPLDISSLPITRTDKAGQSSHLKIINQTNIATGYGHRPSILINGTNAIIAPTFSDQINILDNENAQTPFLLGSYKVPFSSGVWDIKIQGHYAYIVMENGLNILDISKPDHLKIIGTYPTQNDITHLGIDHDRVYLFDKDEGLNILDISNPIVPRLIQYFKNEDISFIKEIAYNYPVLYFWGCNSIHTFDFSDPNHPQKIMPFNTKYDSCPYELYPLSNQFTVFNQIALMNEVYNSEGMKYNLTVLDVSNPNNPLYLHYFDNWCQNCIFGGDSQKFIYFQMGNTLHLMDFSNPRAPVELGYYMFPFDDSDTWYISIGKENLIYVMDKNYNFYTLQYTP
jgi:hypothetical protein